MTTTNYFKYAIKTLNLKMLKRRYVVDTQETLIKSTSQFTGGQIIQDT